MLCLLFHYLFTIWSDSPKICLPEKIFFSLHVVSHLSQVAFSAKIGHCLTVNRRTLGLGCLLRSVTATYFTAFLVICILKYYFLSYCYSLNS